MDEISSTWSLFKINYSGVLGRHSVYVNTKPLLFKKIYSNILTLFNFVVNFLYQYDLDPKVSDDKNNSIPTQRNFFNTSPIYTSIGIKTKNKILHYCFQFIFF